MTLLDQAVRGPRSSFRSAATRVRENVPVVAWTATFVLTFLTTLGPVYSVRLGMGPLTTDLADDGTVEVFFLAFYAALLFGLFAVKRFPKAERSLVLPLSGFFVIVLASTLWSVDTSRTFAQAILLIATALVGLAVGRAASFASQMTAVFASQQLGAVLSVIAVARHAPRSYDFGGRWAGIYITRNSLGPVAALGIISAAACAALLWAQRGRWPTVSVLGAAAGLLAAVGLDSLLLVKSGALTDDLAILATAAGVAVLVVLRWLSGDAHRAATRTAGLTVSSLVALGTIFWLGRSTFLPWVGRDATLDHRTPLWRYLWHFANRRPLGGWGWLGVWRVVDPRKTMGLFEAHNGFLEAYLGTGLIGVLLVIAFAAILLWRVTLTAADRGGQWVWVFALVLYALTVNQLESFIGANLLPWVLLTMAAGSLTRAREREADPL